MGGAFCPWCGTQERCGCRRPAYEAPRHCPQCGRRLRVTVHPTGFHARCRRCRSVSGPAEAHEALRQLEG
ncbi:MAG: hypothetical protein F4236_02760, partial [Acidimicrobiia bacterium]|nr:hypothetical protein [Acidimicrobiia bacterium]